MISRGSVAKTTVGVCALAVGGRRVWGEYEGREPQGIAHDDCAEVDDICDARGASHRERNRREGDPGERDRQVALRGRGADARIAG